MRARRLGGLAVVILLILFSGAYLYFDYMAEIFGECRIVRLTTIPSPDGSKSVVTYRKECGATVPFSSHASIAPAGALFSPEGAPPFFSVRGNQDILAAWNGEQIVRIGLIPGATKAYKRDESVGNIRIEYE
jgi:hypothetical protein